MQHGDGLTQAVGTNDLHRDLTQHLFIQSTQTETGGSEEANGEGQTCHLHAPFYPTPGDSYIYIYNHIIIYMYIQLSSVYVCFLLCPRVACTWLVSQA